MDAREINGFLKGGAAFVGNLTDACFSEPISEVGRWNSLVSESSSRVYSQSGLYFPLDPSAYLARLRLFMAEHDPAKLSQILHDMLLSVEIRNTDRCNSNCWYCYSKREPNRRIDHIPDAAHQNFEDSLLRFAAGTGTKFSVRYCGGGEPLCHDRTVKSILRFEKQGIITNLITNGTLLTPAEITELGACAKMIRFSIDAASSDTYQRTHGVGPELFSRAIANLNGLVQARAAAGREGHGFLGATFLVCQENYHEIEDFVRLMRNIGVDLVWIKSVMPVPPFTPAQLDSIGEQLERAETYSDQRFYVSATRLRVTRAYENMYVHRDADCWSVFTKAFLQPNGNVAICLSRKNYVLGSIRKSDFIKDIWGNSSHVNFIRERGWAECEDCLEERFNQSLQFMADEGCREGIWKASFAEETLGL